eukprot:737056-Pleurochrysis_carterae.AAC.3
MLRRLCKAKPLVGRRADGWPGLGGGGTALRCAGLKGSRGGDAGNASKGSPRGLATSSSS